MALPTEFTLGSGAAKGAGGYFTSERQAMKFLINSRKMNEYLEEEYGTVWTSDSNVSLYDYDSGTTLYNIDTADVWFAAFAEKIRQTIIDSLEFKVGSLHGWIDQTAKEMAANPSDDYEITISVTKPI